MSKSKLTRRKFIATSALATGAVVLSASSYNRIMGANDRVNIAVAGVNSRGLGHIIATKACKNTDVVAFCDVDKRTFDKAQKVLSDNGGGTAKRYADIRKMLADKDIDAITIATPEHWHTPMAIMALQARKHVYLEKPATVNGEEGEMLVEAVRKTGKVLQVGNQQRSAPTSIEGIKDIHDGIIGKAYYGKAWYSNTRGPIGRGENMPVPEWLDWELWQGPAPRRPFKSNYVHYHWHWFWHWGTGEINNNGLHEIDICRWALGVDFPTKVTSSGGRFHFKDDWEFYDTQVASFEFGTEKTITWEGRSCNGFAHYNRGRGATIHGTEGTVLLDRNAYIAYNKDGKVIKQVDEKAYSATTDTMGIGNLDIYHMQNFVNGILKNEPLHSNVVEAHKSTLMCHLGNFAQRVGRTLNIDPNNGRILKDRAAVKFWAREYEKGWEPKV